MIVLTVFSFSPGESQGQVDPDWLRSWNEAEKNRPETLTASSKISPQDEPGIPLIVHGQIFLPDGQTPAPDVIVHSYHRDHAGYEFGPNDNSVTVSPKYQVVIPKAVRESMGIVSGQKIQMLTYGNRIELIPIQPMKKLRGFLRGIDTSVERDSDRV